MEVMGYSEYEICSILRYCIETNTEYSEDTPAKVAAIVGEFKVGEQVIGGK